MIKDREGFNLVDVEVKVVDGLPVYSVVWFNSKLDKTIGASGMTVETATENAFLILDREENQDEHSIK